MIAEHGRGRLRRGRAIPSSRPAAGRTSSRASAGSTGWSSPPEQLAVDRGVVVGAARGGGQRAAGHQDHRRARALDERRQLLLVGLAHPSSVAGPRRQLVGARAAARSPRRRPAPRRPSGGSARGWRPSRAPSRAGRCPSPRRRRSRAPTGGGGSAASPPSRARPVRRALSASGSATTCAAANATRGGGSAPAGAKAAGPPARTLGEPLAARERSACHRHSASSGTSTGSAAPRPTAARARRAARPARPRRSPTGTARRSATWRRNRSHCTLNAVVELARCRAPPATARGSRSVAGTSGFQTGLRRASRGAGSGTRAGRRPRCPRCRRPGTRTARRGRRARTRTS